MKLSILAKSFAADKLLQINCNCGKNRRWRLLTTHNFSEIGVIFRIKMLLITIVNYDSRNVLTIKLSILQLCLNSSSLCRNAMGSGCGSVGTTITSDSRCPQFKSSHWCCKSIQKCFGQWLSWYSSDFQLHRSAVWIQSLAIFLLKVYTEMSIETCFE